VIFIKYWGQNMFRFDQIPPNLFALIASILGILINLDLDINEQNALGNFIVSVGQTMLTAAAQAENQKEHPNKNNICKQIEKMSEELESLKKQLKNC
jgi:hypothetical protein